MLPAHIRLGNPSSNSVGFDPYLVWLDIPPHERPVNYYRLLGLRPLESDPQIIAAAAQRVIDHVARFQDSPHAAACGQLLTELNAARACLLDPARKHAYDSGIGSAAAGEQSLSSPPRPSGSFGQPSPERPLSGPAQQPPAGMWNERQIASTPPVPGGAASASGAAQQLPSPARPGERPATPQTSPPGTSPDRPMHAAPQQPASPASPTHQSGPIQQPPGTATPQPAPVQPPTAAPAPAEPVSPREAPPQWAAGQRTGSVSTVSAGAGSDDARGISTERTQHRRVIRRQQRSQTAYMVVAFAMAMVVFFFGAILLLAIYLSSQ